MRKFGWPWKRTSAPAASAPEQGLTCQELVELVTAYFDGALTPFDRARFDTHLSLCDGCTRYLAQFRQTIQLTGALREDDVPEEAKERLLGAFRGWTSGGDATK
ncbi:MAG: zf-HC2 domain-containing protein [Dehalococcoidia bacterium]|nr:zf-HC2 domain-containing protein [Dehalococcoidia bacterium]